MDVVSSRERVPREQPSRQPARPRPANTTASAPGARLRAPELLVVAALAGLAIVYATDQVVPATSAHQAQLRIWLAARAAGFTALGLLAVQVALGLVLSHPTNKSSWKLSKHLFAWHENAWVFVLAFLAVHVISLVVDPWAGVGIGGAIVPGLSGYRTAPVALGTLSLYALLATGLTARYTRLLPPGAWLAIHRLGVVVFVLAWMHGLLAGTDSDGLGIAYLSTAGVVLAGAFHRYWVAPRRRPVAASAGRPGPTPAARVAPVTHVTPGVVAGDQRKDDQG